MSDPMRNPVRVDERGIALGPILYVLGIVSIAGTVMFTGLFQVMKTSVETNQSLAASTAITSASRSIAIGPDSLLGPGGYNAPAPGALPGSGMPTGPIAAGIGDATYAIPPTAWTVGVVPPTSAAAKTDPWGRPYVFCAWTSVGATATIGPNPAFALISAGPDGQLSTTCQTLTTAATSGRAIGDDRAQLVHVTDLLSLATIWQKDPISDAIVFGTDGSPSGQVRIEAVPGGPADMRVGGSQTVTGVLSVGGAPLPTNGISVVGPGIFTGPITAAGTVISGNSTIGGTLTAAVATVGSLNTTGNASIGGTLNVAGPSTVVDLTSTGLGTFASLHVVGTTILDGPVTASSLISGTDLSLSGTATIGGRLTVMGPSELSSLLLSSGMTVNGAAALNGGLTATTGAIAGGLGVGGAAAPASGLAVSGPITATGTVTAPLFVGTFQGDISGVGNSNFAGDVTVGSLHVLGSTRLDGPLNAYDGAAIDGALGVTGNATVGSLSAAGGVSGSALTASGLISGGSLSTSGMANTGSLAVTTNATVGGNLTVGGVVTMGGLNLPGGATVGSDVTAGGTVSGSRLRATASDPLGLSAASTDPLQIGLSNGINLALSDDEIQARNNGAATTLRLNPLGGAVSAQGGFVGNLTGTASYASALSTARAFSLNGDTTAPAISFDGTGAVTLTTSVVALRGAAIAATAPSVAGQVLRWNGTAWTPTVMAASDIGGGVIGSASDTSLLLADGSATAPSLAFRSNQTTGMFRPSLNAIGFTTNGVQQVQISSGLINLTPTGVQLRLAGVRFAADNSATSNLFLGDTAAFTNGHTGTNNVGIGTAAMRVLTSGARNTSIGYSSLSSVTSGGDNTFAGTLSGAALTTGSLNVGLGSSALGASISGSKNTAIGRNSLRSALDSDNTALGQRALFGLTNGINNIGIGSDAASNLIDGSNNIVIGTLATTSSNNVSDYLNIGGAIRGNLVSRRIAIGTNDDPAVTLDLSSTTDGVALSRGTTLQRPLTPTPGTIRWNTNLTALEHWNGTLWSPLGSGAASGMADGLAILPGWSFTADLDTGFWRPGADLLAISTGGAERARFGAAGLAVTGSISASAGFSGALTGNASTATALAVARSFTITGDTTAPAVTFDGTGNVTLASSVVALRGSAISATAPTSAGQLLRWSGSAWTPATLAANEVGGGVIGGGADTSLQLADGTAAAPALSFRLDSDTGLFRPAADQLGFSVAGTTQMVIGSKTVDFSQLGGQIKLGGRRFAFDNASSSSLFVGDTTAQTNNHTGVENTGFGDGVMRNLSSGPRNTAIGYFAGTNLTSASDNTYVGLRAGEQNLTGGFNTAVGAYSNGSSTVGTYNVAVGYFALRRNTAPNNTALGAWALQLGTTGANNVAIGSNAGSNLTTGSGNIMIGTSALAPTATSSGQLNIGGTIKGDLSSRRIAIGGDASPLVTLDLSVATDGVAVPRGTTIQRPSSASTGTMRWNTDLLSLEQWNGTAWVSFGGSLTMPDGTMAAPGMPFTADPDTGFWRPGADLLAISTGGAERARFGATGLTVTGSISASAGFSGTLTGNASTATALAVARSFTITGDTTAPTVTFDGTGNVALASSVVALRGSAISATAPTSAGQLLRWSGSAWTPATLAANEVGGGVIGASSDTSLLLADGSATAPSLAFRLDSDTGIFRPAADQIGFSVAGVERLRITNNTLYAPTANRIDLVGEAGLYINPPNRVVGVGATNFANTTQYWSVVIGDGAMGYAGESSGNVLIGVDAGQRLSGASNNVGLGEGVMWNSGAAKENTAIGYYAMGNAWGVQNVAIGNMALNNGQGAARNIVIGRDAGKYTTQGNDNILIGNYVETVTSTTNNSITIGSLIFGDMGTNRFWIGRTSTLGTAALPTMYFGSETNSGIYRDTANTLSFSIAGSQRLRLHSTGVNCYTACTGISDVRLKTHIEGLADGLALVERLRPVAFQWRDTGRPDIGFIAQEVSPVLPALVGGAGTDEDPHTLNYGAMAAPMVGAIQELSARVKALEAANDNLRTERAGQADHLARLESRLTAVESSNGNQTFPLALLFVAAGLGAVLTLVAKRKKAA